MEDVQDDPHDEPSGEPESVGDDRLRLIFTCCHPALSLEARVALTLAGGVEPACGRHRADLPHVREHHGTASAAGQAEDGQRWPSRSACLLPTYSRNVSTASSPSSIWCSPPATRRSTTIWRPRGSVSVGCCVELMPDSDEVRGLLALMLFQHARRGARMVDDELVTLEEQDRVPVGHRRHQRGAVTRPVGGWRARAVPDPGRPRRGPRHRTRRQFDGLAAHRRALRRAARRPPVARRRAQPGRRRRHERWSTGRAARARRRRRRQLPGPPPRLRPLAASYSPGPDGPSRRAASSTGPSRSPRPTRAPPARARVGTGLDDRSVVT